MAVKIYDSDQSSVQLLESITNGLDFGIRDVDFDSPYFSLPQSVLDALMTPQEKLTDKVITSRRVDGTGIFDAFMKAFSVHIKEEYDAGRITGAEYTKAYVSLAGTAMQCAVQFALGKDQAYWQALGQQIAGINANIQNAMAKVQLAIAQAQAHQNKANYANTVIKLAEEDAQYALIKESYEAKRGETLDTRSDGQKVVGTVGKQKDLYDKQIWAYQRDAEYKAAGIWNNAYITMKGIDEGLSIPSQYNQANINEVLQNLRSKLPL